MSLSESRGPVRADAAESQDLVRSIRFASQQLLHGAPDRDAVLKERLAMLRRLVALRSPAGAATLLGVSIDRVEQELRNDTSIE